MTAQKSNPICGMPCDLAIFLSIAWSWQHPRVSGKFCRRIVRLLGFSLNQYFHPQNLFWGEGREESGLMQSSKFAM